MFDESGEPETLTIDPGSNPFFFTYFWLAMTSEWWAISYTLGSLLTSMRSIHRVEDRRKAIFTERINKLTSQILIADLVSRKIFWIVPGLIGGVTDNKYNLTVISVWNYMAYKAIKYTVFPALWIRALTLALKTPRSPGRESDSKSGSTVQAKMHAFERKMQFFLLAGCYAFILRACWPIFHVVADKPWSFADIIYQVMKSAGTTIMIFFSRAKILYFTVISSMLLETLSCLKKLRRRGQQTNQGQQQQKTGDSIADQYGNELELWVMGGSGHFSADNPIYIERNTKT